METELKQVLAEKLSLKQMTNKWFKRFCCVLLLAVVINVLWFYSTLHDNHAAQKNINSRVSHQVPYYRWVVVVMDTNDNETFPLICRHYKHVSSILIKTANVSSLDCGQMELRVWNSQHTNDGNSSLASLDDVFHIILQENPNSVCFVNMSNLQACKYTSSTTSVHNDNVENVLVYDGPEILPLFPMKYHFGCENFSPPPNISTQPASYQLCEVYLPLETTACLGKTGSCNTHLPPVALVQGNFYPIPFYGTNFQWRYFWAIKPLYISNTLSWTVKVRFILNLWIHDIITRMGLAIQYHYVPELHSQCSSLPHSLPSKTQVELIRSVQDIALTVKFSDHSKLKQMFGGLDNIAMLIKWFELLQLYNYPSQVLWGLEKKKFPCVNQRNMLYSPTKLAIRKGKRLTSLYEQINNTYSELCAWGALDFKKYLIHHQPVYKDVLLVVIYNHQNYHSISTVELVYGLFFPHIIFCGPKSPNVYDLKSKTFRINFIEYQAFGVGLTSYECAVITMSMGYKFQGYLFLTEDSLFNMQTFKQLKISDVWLTGRGEIYDAILNPFPSVFVRNDLKHHFKSKHQFWNKNTLLNFLREFQKLSEVDEVMKKCYINLANFTGDTWRLYGTPNIGPYFIPHSFSHQAVDILKLFLSNDIASEVAVATTLLCLSHPDKLSVLRDMTLSGEKQRQFPWELKTAKEMLSFDNVQPVRLELFVPPGGVKTKHFLSAVSFLCNEILPVFHGIRKPSKNVYKTWD